MNTQDQTTKGRWAGREIDKEHHESNVDTFVVLCLGIARVDFKHRDVVAYHNQTDQTAQSAVILRTGSTQQDERQTNTSRTIKRHKQPKTETDLQWKRTASWPRRPAPSCRPCPARTARPRPPRSAWQRSSASAPVTECECRRTQQANTHARKRVTENETKKKTALQSSAEKMAKIQAKTRAQANLFAAAHLFRGRCQQNLGENRLKRERGHSDAQIRE